VMIYNLTPHSIDVIVTDGKTVTLAPESTPARVTQTIRESGYTDPETGIPISITEYGEVIDLPAPVDGIWYVVSAITLKQCSRIRGTRDLLIPVDMVRDEFGAIIGCRALANPFNTILINGTVYPERAMPSDIKGSVTNE